MEKLFEVNKGLIGLNIPSDIALNVNSTVDITLAAYKGIIAEKMKEAVNGMLEVYTIGEGVTFAKEGEKIMIASHSRPQQIEIDVEGQKYPSIFLIIRESDCIIKM